MSKPFVHIKANGQKFGKWLVTDDSKSAWKVICECGLEKSVRRDYVLRGISKSCIKCAQKKHGMEATKAYNTWAAMKQRCNNESNKFFSNYGARGIKVCEEWNSFEGFFSDMGQPPKGNHISLDRINNDLGYFKENCRWATSKQQARNRRNNIYVEYEGVKYPLPELAEKFGLTPKLVRDRLKAGIDLHTALTKVVLKK